jgi:alpha-D-ribose 1-methylphosphonate 5-triphosphate diphosphatase
VSRSADPTESYAVAHVRAVVGDRIVDDATVVVEESHITEIVEAGTAPSDAVDGRGAFLIPGVICTHSDGVEREIWPRPNTRFPVDFALRSFEGRLRAAGVTTVFHGIGFDHQPAYDRTIEQAIELGQVIRDRRGGGGAPATHLVLHRMEARSDRGWAELANALPHSEGLGHLPLLSFEDHSPGQGQFRDIEEYKRAFDASSLADGETVESAVVARLADAKTKAGLRELNLTAVKALAQQRRVRLLAHDLEDADQVRDAATWGTSVAEFPLSRDAAEEARRCDLAVVMGAPNVLRGGSHSGNVSAAELVTAGLCTSLASDYQPSTMLAAAFKLAADGHCALPEAIGLITSGPAAAAGLDDRGRLEPGRRADLALVTLDGAWPRVQDTWRAPDLVAVPA